MIHKRKNFSENSKILKLISISAKIDRFFIVSYREKMKSPLKFMTVNAVLVTDFGTRGKCVNCAKYAFSMLIHH